MDLTLEPMPLPFPPSEVFARLAGTRGLAFLDSGIPDGSSVYQEPAGPRFSWVAIEPLETLDDDIPEIELGRPLAPRGLREPPFGTGWIGFVAYEGTCLLDGGAKRQAARGLPLSWWGRYAASLAYDHGACSWLLARDEGAEGRDAAARLLDAIAHPRAIANPHAVAHPRARPLAFRAGAPHAAWTQDEHATRVRAILDWIAGGHIYQANLTYPIRGEFAGDPEALFLEMRRQSPAPHGAFLRVREDLAILSSSPERLIEVDGSRISTEPIKGTRPRDLRDPIRDRALAEELLASPKDRAELTMIVDLERNDLGRLCRYGTVRTETFPRLVSLPTVHHLVATIHGELREPILVRDILGATFPGGSVTGAPKIRAMEILAQLEAAPRFAYCGALGYLDPRGSLDLALPIRTLYTHGTNYEFGVGGGIVADSDPAAEWLETEHKAIAIVRALATGAPFPTPNPTPASCP